MSENYNKRLSDIEARNKRVEIDKAWETSWTRRIVIFLLTYIIATVWLVLIDNQQPFLNAMVPALGWVLSTLTLPIIKKNWIRLIKSD